MSGPDSRAPGAPAPEAPAPELPAALGAMAAQVARLTRLRRAERRDVERELRSHFAEAIAAGRTAQQALDTFGDPKTSARDLRRAAIAKRSPLDRAFMQALRLTGGAIAALVLLYATFAAYLSLKSPSVHVDTLAAMRDRLAVPATPEDDAWPLYRQAFLALGLGVDDAKRQSKGAEAIGATPMPGAPEWTAAVEWAELPEHRAALDVLRAAAARPVFGYPVAGALGEVDAPLFGTDAVQHMNELIATRDDPTRFPLLGILLPHLASARHAARFLAVDAMRGAEVGDGDRFVADIEAMMRMSVHLSDGRVLIGDLVGMAIRGLAIERAMAALEWKPDLLDGAQLARLQRAFECVPPALGQLDLGTDRLMWLDVEQRLYTDDGRGNGWFRLDRDTLLPLMATSHGVGVHDRHADSTLHAASLAAATLSGPAAALMVADRQTTHDFIEEWATRMEKASALPLREHAVADAMELEFHAAIAAAPVNLLLPRLLMPSFGKAATNFAVDRARREAAATVCAVLRFRADAGTWPRRPEDLVPTYLSSVPLDPWTDAPIHMATDADGFRMWSTGEDGRDDGGVPDARDDAAWGGPRATTLPLRRDDRSPSNWADEIPRIDWVWFAPRGQLTRWVEAP